MNSFLEVCLSCRNHYKTFSCVTAALSPTLSCVKATCAPQHRGSKALSGVNSEEPGQSAAVVAGSVR